MYHHVLGLLAAIRGVYARAIGEFRAAIFSTTLGYTRTNYQLARVLLRDRRASEAIALLQPALRGPIEASNLYVSRREPRELLAQSWETAGGRDSAIAQYRTVVDAWRAADPTLASRASSARARLTALTR